MPNFYTNVKSRLNKKGIKGLTKTDFMLAAEHLGIEDMDNATTEQIIAGVEYLMSNHSSELAPIKNDDAADSAIAHSEMVEAGRSHLTVSSADKQSLVATQSSVLGVELSEQETTAIADTVDDVFSDYSSFLKGVTSAIKQYVDHRFDGIESTLDNNTEELRSHIADRATKLNQKVANYAGVIKQDTEVIRNNLKTSKEVILSRFRVGILSAK